MRLECIATGPEKSSCPPNYFCMLIDLVYFTIWSSNLGEFFSHNWIFFLKGSVRFNYCHLPQFHLRMICICALFDTSFAYWCSTSRRRQANVHANNQPVLLWSPPEAFWSSLYCRGSMQLPISDKKTWLLVSCILIIWLKIIHNMAEETTNRPCLGGNNAKMSRYYSFSGSPGALQALSEYLIKSKVLLCFHEDTGNQFFPRISHFEACRSSQVFVCCLYWLQSPPRTSLRATTGPPSVTFRGPSLAPCGSRRLA